MCMDVCVGGWMKDRWVDPPTKGWMEQWMNDRCGEWMDGWVDR